MAVLLVATLDTKGDEAAFVRDRLAAVGCVTMDASVLGQGKWQADIPPDEVSRAAGTTLEAMRAAERGEAVEAASRGAARIARRLHDEGRIAGVLGLGGSAGTAIGTAAMRALPVGVPKLMVSTLASGQVRPYVGVRDVCMMHAVVDIAGLNRVSRAVLANAAAAMAGMVRAEREAGPDKPIIAASMFGVTTPCVQEARGALEAAGYEVLVFHATGSGGQTLEALVADGAAVGVLDATTTELADELAGGILSAGPDRLTAAGARGVPQVVSVGAVDMANFGPADTVPARFADRRFHRHNPMVTLMRTTPEENAAIAEEIGRKLSAARGPAALFVPLRGVSALDREGGPFWWPEADAALFAALRKHCGPNVALSELDLHINDPGLRHGDGEGSPGDAQWNLRASSIFLSETFLASSAFLAASAFFSASTRAAWSAKPLAM